MINLLPNNYKEQIVYGRKNLVLTHWIIAMFMAMAAILAVSFAGTILLYKTTDNQKKAVESAKQQLTAKKLDQNYKNFNNLVTDFNTVVSIATQQIRYSNIINSITPLLPEGTTLNGIELQQGVNAVEIKLNGQSKESLTQALVNIADKKNNVFEKADFNNINCKVVATTGGDSSTEEPPCKVSIKGLLAKNKDFYFITPEDTKK